MDLGGAAGVARYLKGCPVARELGIDVRVLAGSSVISDEEVGRPVPDAARWAEVCRLPNDVLVRKNGLIGEVVDAASIHPGAIGYARSNTVASDDVETCGCDAVCVRRRATCSIDESTGERDVVASSVPPAILPTSRRNLPSPVAKKEAETINLRLTPGLNTGHVGQHSDEKVVRSRRVAIDADLQGMPGKKAERCSSAIPSKKIRRICRLTGVLIGTADLADAWYGWRVKNVEAVNANTGLLPRSSHAGKRTDLVDLYAHSSR